MKEQMNEVKFEQLDVYSEESQNFEGVYSYRSSLEFIDGLLGLFHFYFKQIELTFNEQPDDRHEIDNEEIEVSASLGFVLAGFTHKDKCDFNNSLIELELSDL